MALHYPKAVYDALFGAAWQVLETFGKQKGLQMGIIAVPPPKVSFNPERFREFHGWAFSHHETLVIGGWHF
ncbi:hypothetical protein GVN20_23745 [Runella sp. CRIBMP]|nr:hypothetical protein [Runella sp. CRIBMP]NBB22387.1 hypothetical protein [Runella sp. CRIBMP]